ncbi:hypothetical protein WOLCODRAFT_157896 [Wolfiporia cocos MD-104 SS10]|uniref:Uncharacterized protein n=1 Tax=Wolfiporia cocos (strain MD-104) TaxID=742152 RepID=A0A2H3JBK1_WOLCO|nr:hypothetical protein WOLCODRAFT_157896 [Wolfiporia cocos MD-104 SS10]
MENSVHYASNTPQGIAEWNSTLPTGGGILHLGDDLMPFSISMFHHLRCLDIIRESLASRMTGDVDTPPSMLDRHCMNYLRQMILCHADLRLEPVRSVTKASGNTISDLTHTCQDWTALYTAAEENHRSWLAKSTAEQTHRTV